MHAENHEARNQPSFLTDSEREQWRQAAVLPNGRAMSTIKYLPPPISLPFADDDKCDFARKKSLSLFSQFSYCHAVLYKCRFFSRALFLLIGRARRKPQQIEFEKEDHKRERENERRRMHKQSLMANDWEVSPKKKTLLGFQYIN